jgi:hypothetical protein
LEAEAEALRAHLRFVATHTGMFFLRPRFFALVGYINGLENGGRDELRGWNQWMGAELAGSESSVYWSSQALQRVAPAWDPGVALSPDQDDALCRITCEALDRFLADRGG